MRKYLYTILLCLFMPVMAQAIPVLPTDENIASGIAHSANTKTDYGPEFITPDTRNPDDTKCATAAFARALAQNANKVSENDSEIKIQDWIQETFSDQAVLESVLACPEVASAADDQTIVFLPIKYTFTNGREIVVNYETQPKIFKQRILLAKKRSMPASDPNPRLGPDDGAVWTHTDPSWYAVMITEHGALDHFVGPDKNNTVSLTYIKDHIDDLYPNASTNGGACTSRSAAAEDYCVINKTGKRATTDDSNDYYVAGDINLQWLSYLQIALDVVLTVASFGGYTVLSGALKGKDIVKTMNGLRGTLSTLRKSDKVVDWVKTTNKINKLNDEIKLLDKTADAAKIADKTKELDKLKDTAKALEKTDDVAKYRDASETYSELNKMRHTLNAAKKAMRLKQRGNILARGAKVFKGARTALKGNKLINHGAKLARSGSLANRARDWLFHSTLQNAGALAKMGAGGSVLYGGLKFIGGMYDWTETSTGEYTSGVDFSPLLLLSADELKGQENVVNHGMWLLWMGDTSAIEDDDAAYLQAMDFAAKFHQELIDEQDNSSSPCNVDIYVVHPILRNPGSDNPELYYLIMNDEPWTTAQ